MNDKLKIGDLVLVTYKNSCRIAEVVGEERNNYANDIYLSYRVKTLYDCYQDPVAARYAKIEVYDRSWLVKLTPEFLEKKINFWKKIYAEIQCM